MKGLRDQVRHVRAHHHEEGLDGTHVVRESEKAKNKPEILFDFLTLKSNSESHT